jgi:hypothetical protein
MNTLTIKLSTGTTVEIRDPSCLLGLTKDEFEELKLILNSSKEAAA